MAEGLEALLRSAQAALSAASARVKFRVIGLGLGLDRVWLGLVVGWG